MMEQAFAGTQGSAGYARSEAQAEAVARARFAGSYAEQEAGARSRQEESARKAEFLEKEAAGKGQAVSRTTAGRVAAEESYRKALEATKGDKAGGQELANLAEAANHLKKAADEEASALEEARAATERSKTAREQELSVIQQSTEARKNTLQAERDRQQGIVLAEKTKLQASQASFGLMTPMQQAQMVNLSRDVKRGRQNFSEREIQFMQGREEFKPFLEQLGRRRGGTRYDEVVQNLGLDTKMKEAEAAKVAIDHKLTLTLSADGALVKQVAEQVAGQLQQQRSQTATQISSQLSRQNVENTQQRQAAVRQNMGE
jgi:hypothetical protein